MRVHRTADLPLLPPTALCFGNFDGVHLGHRALLRQVRAAADALHGEALVVTFAPHPLAVLQPHKAPPAIDTLDARLEGLAAAGLDAAYVLTFDAELALRPAEWFARELLCGTLGARVVVVGPGTRFGHGGRGDRALLERVLAEVGGRAETCDGVIWQGSPVSSSRVREAVQGGAVAAAAAMLGRPYCLRGVVVAGDARGRTIGFPTANVAAPGAVLPSAGVYACRLGVDGTWHGAVTNVGVRPTFAGEALRVEAHVFDFEGDLYGKPVELAFLQHLRDERRFADVAALRAQIAADVIAAREALAGSREASATVV
jgi:riboflavin kinase/FMN adenylyltransferase